MLNATGSPDGMQRPDRSRVLAVGFKALRRFPAEPLLRTMVGQAIIDSPDAAEREQGLRELSCATVLWPDAAVADRFFDGPDALGAAARLREAGFTPLLVDLEDLRRLRERYGAFAACDHDSGSLAEALGGWRVVMRAPLGLGILLEVP